MEETKVTDTPLYTLTQSAIDVKLVDKLGSDLTVVNSARISFGTEANKLTKRDQGLIRYLAKHKHFSPFRHCMIQFRIRMPEFIARQMYKHVVGIEGTSVHPTKDHAWNEISGRYKPLTELYMPPVWYEQHPSAKQCSGSEHVKQKEMQVVYEEAVDHLMKSYHKMLEAGVAKEQARMMLPLSFMTEVFWTASLQAVQNFVVLRKSHDAQTEIQELATRLEELTREAFPVAFAALMDEEPESEKK